MKDYDVIVVGSRAGAIIVEQALKVALMDKGLHQRYAYPSGHAEVRQTTVQNLPEPQ